MKGVFYMASFENTAAAYHRLELEGREKLTVSGVEDVARFDEGCIVLTTADGTLVISGEDLHIGKLSLEGGELCVDGRIDVLAYEDSSRERGGRSLLSRLFG
jgi:sporulation protein YabP